MFTSTQITKLKSYIKNLRPTLGGKFLFYSPYFRRNLVLKNMRLVFGEVLTASEIETLALAFYSHAMKSLFEVIRSYLFKQRVEVIVQGEEYLLELAKKGEQGAIIITGHFGNWEIAPLAGMTKFKEFCGRIYFVRKLLRVKIFEKLLFGRYTRAGLGVIPKEYALHQVTDVLNNRNAVVFVIDQYALRKKEGMLVEFFGKKTKTFKTPAMVAKYTDAAVVPARSYRRPDGVHILEFLSPLKWQVADSLNEELYLNTKKYNEMIEQFVVEYPEQWLWSHRRWRDED